MKVLISAASILAGLVMASGAGAGPLSPQTAPLPIERTVTSGLVEQVDYACGRGWHLSRDGICRRSRPPGPPRYYRPPPGWGWGPPGYHRPPPDYYHRPPPGYYHRPPPGWGPPPRW